MRSKATRKWPIGLVTLIKPKTCVHEIEGWSWVNIAHNVLRSFQEKYSVVACNVSYKVNEKAIRNFPTLK